MFQTVNHEDMEKTVQLFAKISAFDYSNTVLFLIKHLKNFKRTFIRSSQTHNKKEYAEFFAKKGESLAFLTKNFLHHLKKNYIDSQTAQEILELLRLVADLFEMFKYEEGGEKLVCDLQEILCQFLNDEDFMAEDNTKGIC